MAIIMIALVDENNAIQTVEGRPISLKLATEAFQRIIKNETTIYSRGTYNAFHSKTLSSHHNIMLSKTALPDQYPGIHVSPNVDDVCKYLHDIAEGCKPSIFIIGGESVYRRFMDIAKYVILVRVHTKFNNPTKFFPDISTAFKMDSFVYDDIDPVTSKSFICEVEFYSLHSYNPLDDWGKFNGPLNAHTADIRRARLIWMSTRIGSILNIIR